MAAIMRGLEGEAYDRTYSDRDLYKRIGAYFAPQRKRITTITIAVLMLSVFNALPVIIISRGVEAISEGGNPSLIPFLITIIFINGVLIWAVNWVKRINAVNAVENVVLAMRTDGFDAAARQDMSFFDDFSSGRIVSRITSDTEEFGRVVILGTDLIQQLATAIILLVFLININFRLTSVIFLMTPIVVVAATTFRTLARRATQQSSRVLGEVNKSIQEAVTGIGVAKNFRQEASIYHDFLDVNAQSYKINIRRGLVLALIFPTLATLLGIATGGLIYFGGRAVLATTITAAAWYLFLGTIDRFWFPLLNISAFWSQLQQGLSAAERVFALIDSPASISQTADSEPPILDGSISFETVTFGYNPQEPILRDFDLEIPAGQTIAIVGHTGAGKSSIIKLVTRFYEFQKGTLSIDGHDIRSFNLPAYRSQLGIVNQVPFLFDGTVAENIRYGKPNASDQEINTIAETIGGGDWLDTLPDGLDTPVGERGSRLSMGQRQLVALARVLISDPAIFILDEATANIDPFTESQIQSALQLIMQDRTSIVIAHRLSTVRSAERILVLENGAIIESGSHDELITLGGNYANLYDTYFRHQSLDYINQRGWQN